MAREMKSTGIPWIGSIPKTWKIGRLKDIKSDDNYSIVDGPFGTAISTDDYVDEGVPLARIVNLDGLKLSEKNFVYITNEHAINLGRSRFFKGDIIFAKTGATVGKCALNTNVDSGILSSSCIKIQVSKKYSNRFFYYFFNSSQFNEALRMSCNGTTRDTINLKPFASLNCVIPPLEDQKKIANYLETECTSIDSVIEQTRASIEEYKKLKQAVITQAVTKGIRSDRQMKDSGIEWIGKIPTSWRVTKLKYYSQIRSGITLGKVYPVGTELIEYPYLRVANVQGSYTDLTDVATIKVTQEEAKKYRLHKGELLMTEGGDRDKLGRGSVWHAEIDPCLHQNHVFALHTESDCLLAEYVSYLTDSYVGRDYFDVTANQSVHLASTNSTTIMNFRIPFPPIDEQKQIVTYLEAKIQGIDKLIQQKEYLLYELDSYKKSMIFEYVTGKKEVPA